ncbi:MAG: hypothetical protein CMN78_05440 [Spirochaetales bacterium]|nr:hypothetical protein [Spirochaetales bacterium]
MLHKVDRFGQISGPLILFLVIFLPGYLYQSAESAAQSLSTPSSLLLNLVIGIPQVFLLLFVMLANSQAAAYGLSGLKLRGIPRIFAILGGIVLLSAIASLLSRALGTESLGFIGTIELDLRDLPNIILLALVCLTTGYKEELFFRSYMFVDLVAVGQKEYTAAAISALFFSIGHIYEGIASFLGTLVIGGFLAWCFTKTRNIHLLAIAHALYNFGIIIGISFFK